MQPVLLHHSNATAGVLAWRGIIAAATVFAEYASRASHDSLSGQCIQSTGKEASKRPSDGAEWPSPSADSPSVLTPSFRTELPGVMPCYSCLSESAASPSTHTTEKSNEAVHGLHQPLQPVFRLLKADEGLMRPYIAALIAQAQHSIGRVDVASQAQPSSPSLCDGAERGRGRRPAEGARQADGLDDAVAKLAVGSGGKTAVAAVEALLALCEEQGLLVQVLGLLQLLSEACSTLRCVVLQTNLALLL